MMGVYSLVSRSAALPGLEIDMLPRRRALRVSKMPPPVWGRAADWGVVGRRTQSRHRFRHPHKTNELATDRGDFGYFDNAAVCAGCTAGCCSVEGKCTKGATPS